MSKITLSQVNLLDPLTATTVINNNSAIIQSAFDDTLSRDGTAPNQMQDVLDMNSQQIINLPTPATANSALRLQDLNNFIGGGTVTNIPPGGSIHQVLTKHSAANFDVDWEDGASILAGTNIVFAGANPTTISTSLTPTFTTVTGNLIGNASTVTTNANLTGDVTSVGNATTLATVATGATVGSATLIPIITFNNKGLVTSATTTAVTATTNANLTGPITSVGNATSIASQTGTGTTFVVNTSPTLVTPNIGTATGTGLIITSSSASALAVGPNGATAPIFQVAANGASAANGVIISGTVAGSAVFLSAQSTATDEALCINSKGAGGLVLQNVGTGSIAAATSIVSNVSGVSNLGSSGLPFGNLFLKSGATINFSTNTVLTDAGGGGPFTFVVGPNTNFRIRSQGQNLDLSGRSSPADDLAILRYLNNAEAVVIGQMLGDTSGGAGRIRLQTGTSGTQQIWTGDVNGFTIARPTFGTTISATGGVFTGNGTPQYTGVTSGAPAFVTVSSNRGEYTMWNTTGGTTTVVGSMVWGNGTVGAAGRLFQMDVVAGGAANSGTMQWYVFNAGAAVQFMGVTPPGQFLFTAVNGGYGYSTGFTVGGTVTQITSRATGVTLSKLAGDITLLAAVNAAVSLATAVTITVTNTQVVATDNIIISQKSGTDKYHVFVTHIQAGSFNITWYTTGGVTNESPVFHFDVIKSTNN